MIENNAGAYSGTRLDRAEGVRTICASDERPDAVVDPSDRPDPDTFGLVHLELRYVIRGRVPGSPYRGNAFRLADLPTDADASRMEGGAAESVANDGYTGPRTRHAVLPVLPLPGDVDIAAVLRDGRDPVARLVAELFWFWPTEYTDPAVDGIDQANAEWLDRLPGDPIAAHNLAVLRHIEAFETPQGDHPETWLDALTAWDMTIGAAGTWRWLHVRAEQVQVGDDRLRFGPADLAELRQELPAAILRIHANAIAVAALGDRMDAAAMQLEVLHRFAAQAAASRSVFDPATVLSVRDEIAREILSGIPFHVSGVVDKATRDPRSGLHRARDLLTSAARVVAFLRVLGSEDPESVNTIKTETTTAATRAIAVYYRACNDGPGTRAVLADIRGFASGTSAVRYLDQVTYELDETWLAETCWFCHARPSVAGASRVVGRQKVLRYPRAQETRIDVPRCVRCRFLHWLDNVVGTVPTALTLLGVVLLAINMATGMHTHAWPLLGLVGAMFLGSMAVGVLLAFKFPSGLADFKSAEKYPGVEKLRYPPPGSAPLPDRAISEQ